MTTPARPARTPTPADLASRISTRTPAPATAPSAARLPRAADAIAPGVLREKERLRPMIQRSLRISRMRPEARLVAHVLLGYAHWDTGILSSHQPDDAELAYACGLTTGQVRVQLEVLRQRGWLTSVRLTRGQRQGQVVPQLCIPAAVLQHVRDRAAHTTR